MCLFVPTPTRRRAEPRRQLLPISEFAQHAGISTSTVRRLAKLGLLPVYRVAATGRKPGALRIDLRDLDLVIRRESPELVG